MADFLTNHVEGRTAFLPFLLWEQSKDLSKPSLDPQLWGLLLWRQGLNEQLYPRILEAENLHHTFVLWGFIKSQSCQSGNILNVLVGFLVHLFVWVFLPSNQQAVLPFITLGVFFYFKFGKLRSEADHNYLIKSLGNPANNYMCVGGCVCECISYETHIKTS